MGEEEEEGNLDYHKRWKKRKRSASAIFFFFNFPFEFVTMILTETLCSGDGSCSGWISKTLVEIPLASFLHFLILK